MDSQHLHNNNVSITSSSTIQNHVDEDFGDFADFQTFSDSTTFTTSPFSSEATTNRSNKDDNESLLSPSSALSNNTSSNSTPSHGSTKTFTLQKYLSNNIYELDMFTFQEFVTNFEEQLLQMFDHNKLAIKLNESNNNNDEDDDTNNFNKNNNHNQSTNPIHSQEDIVNDCP